MRVWTRWTMVLALGALLAACEQDSGGGAKHGEGATPADVVVARDGGGGDGGVPRVDAGGPSSSNHPPVLHKIGDKVAPVGERLEIVLAADDPDGDPLSFSVFGDIPLGAEFDKNLHVFQWTPKEDRVGMCSYVTFVVSDGPEFDRETIQICARDKAEAHLPTFLPLSAQYPVAGKLFRLQLEATDHNGDTLTFGIEGTAPEGAALVAATGVFTWTPLESQAGPDAIPIRFTVTDGGEPVSQEVLFYVQNAGATAHPPVFDPIADQAARVGQELAFGVHATDPDGDSLVYSMLSGTPAGAIFNTGALRFTWTPAEDDAGRRFEVTFTVTDGTFDVKLTVPIFVAEATGPPPTCSADSNEPNETPADATPAGAGTFGGLSICDAAVGGADDPDRDWFLLTAAGGQVVQIDVTFTHADGDIDVMLFRVGNDQPVARSASTTDNERIIYTTAESGGLLLSVYGYSGGGAGPVANSYTLQIQMRAEACPRDAFEENDTEGGAAVLTGAQLQEGLYGLSLCPGDLDWYRVDLTCGQNMTLLMTFTHADGDLDLIVFGPTGSEPVAQGVSADDDETVAVENVPVSGPYFVRVQGWPIDQTQNSYDLLGEITGGADCCEDTLEPDNGPAEATTLSGEDSYPHLTLCGDADWFQRDLGIGDGVLVQAVVSQGAIRLVGLAADGATVVAEAVVRDNSHDLEVENVAQAGTYFLVVEPVATPATYSLDAFVFPAN